MYAAGKPDRPLDGGHGTITVGAGETEPVGIRLDTHGVPAGASREYAMRVHADEDDRREE